MTPEKRKLARLQRLEKVRAIAKQAALASAAEAEAQLARLDRLSQRTNDMVADYARRGDAADGADLRRLAGFRSGLVAVGARATADVVTARQVADVRQGELVRAERSRAAVEDRARAQAEAIARAARTPSLGVRKAIGTDLE